MQNTMKTEPPKYILDAIEKGLSRLPEQHRSRGRDALIAEWNRSAGLTALYSTGDGGFIEAKWLRDEVNGRAYWLGYVGLVSHSSRFSVTDPNETR